METLPAQDQRRFRLGDGERVPEGVRRIACPVLALWAASGALPGFYGDPLELWRPWAPDLRGGAVDASHFLAEDRPQETAQQVPALLADR